MLQVAKVFKALQCQLQHLATLYEKSPMPPQPEYPFLKTLRDGSTLTYKKKIKINVFCCEITRRDNTHAEVIVKFIQGPNYGVKAHKYMASQKHAPDMLSFEEVTSSLMR